MAALVVVSTTAHASCAGTVSVEAAIQSAPTAFVGTITDVSSGGRVARVHVDDVWRGTGIPSSVDVIGTPDLSAAATSVDRTYAVGSKYLFVPEGGGPERFTDNACTATQLYSGNLAVIRPVGAPGAPAQSASAFPALQVVAGFIALTAAVCAVVLYRRRRRHPA